MDSGFRGHKTDRTDTQIYTQSTFPRSWAHISIVQSISPLCHSPELAIWGMHIGKNRQGNGDRNLWWEAIISATDAHDDLIQLYPVLPTRRLRSEYLCMELEDVHPRLSACEMSARCRDGAAASARLNNYLVASSHFVTYLRTKHRRPDPRASVATPRCCGSARWSSLLNLHNKVNRNTLAVLAGDNEKLGH